MGWGRRGACPSTSFGPELEGTTAGGSLLGPGPTREVPALKSGVLTPAAPAGDQCEDDVSPVTVSSLASCQLTQEGKCDPQRWSQVEDKRRAAGVTQAPRSPLVVAEVTRGVVGVARSKLGSSREETKKL